MAKIDTLTAYKCSFKYLQRNNPLKDELKDKLKDEVPPDYAFEAFINDFCEFTESLAIGEVSERAIFFLKKMRFLAERKMVPVSGELHLLRVNMENLLRL